MSDTLDEPTRPRAIRVLLEQPERPHARIPDPLKWAGAIVSGLFTMGVGAMAAWLIASVSAMQVTLARMDERMANQATIQRAELEAIRLRVARLESYHEGNGK